MPTTTMPQTTTQARKLEIALDLIDFCGADLTVSACHDFFRIHDYESNEQEQTEIFMIALGLIKK